MQNDPDETCNLAEDASCAELIRDMDEKLEAWFERYMVKEMDARKFPNTGRGQKNICYKEGAFDQSMCYFGEDGFKL